MRRLLLIAVFICSTSLLSSCSMVKPFVIINESHKEIIVEYAVNEDLITPLMMSAAKRNSWFNRNDWEQMPEDRYTVDYKAKKGAIKIKPQEAVMIHKERDNSDIKEIEKNFDLKNLRIKENGKEIYFEDSKRLFEEFTKNDFEITYK